ncbi:unnamed protein product [Parnassius mnemosyne]|uniref:Uncharacterized protein n=1 Tax=Parnassius mnemosyne TaxID=213953 RepID=A0AAV1KG26_9NEOP
MATPGKLKKKKKEVEFSADNIDSTAPVKKILEDLRLQNEQAYNFYCQNIRQRLTTKKSLQNFHFIVPGHPLNAFSKDWDGQLISNYFEAFPYKSLNPKIITELHHVIETDPVTKIMKVKSDWQWQCRNLRVTASCSNMISKYESLNEEVVHCPKHLVDMAMHLDSDPDPHFDSSYNWYYAGRGNMQLICIHWRVYLLHSEFSKLYISEFDKNNLTKKSSPEATFDCGEGMNILETIHSSQNIVALRTKKKVFILKILLHDDEIKFEKIKSADSETPYTGISFDDYHKNILYVTTFDNNLTIVNLDRMTGRSVKLKSKRHLINDWSTVLSSERGFYTHVSTDNITLYDKRSNDVIYLWKNLRDVTDEVGCNNISCAIPTEGQSLYIGTDHHLFLMDLRYLNKHKPKPVNRWTHGMQCVPTYISKCNFEFNKDLICLSSQWCEDMCVIPNSNDRVTKESDQVTVTIPYRPPSILNTLKSARQKLLCYDLYNPIDGRLHTAITGNLIVERDDKFDILMQNSLGDITCHTIFPEHLEIFMEDDSCQRIDEWCKSYKLERKHFEVSSIEDISHVWNNLKSVPDDYKIVQNRKYIKGKDQFNENEIFKAFEEEELDVGLLELWTNPAEETVDKSSFALNLHFSDSDDDTIK